MTQHRTVKEGEHTWYTVHHTDPDGNHWCPTGFEMCAHCAGFRHKNVKDVCFTWGTKPEASK